MTSRDTRPEAALGASTDISATLETAWRDQRAWSSVANRAKAVHDRAQSTVLILALAGAALETLAVQSPVLGLRDHRVVFMYAGAVALALVPVITRLYLGKERLQLWVEARGLAEGVKAEVYRYRTGIGPYASREPDRALMKFLEHLRSPRPALDRLRMEVQPTGEPVPPTMDAATYIEHRVERQVSAYYRPRASHHARRARLLRRGIGFLTVLAAVVGTAAAVSDSTSLAAWVAVLTTAVTAVTAHLVARRHEELVSSYTATADRLELLRDAYRDGITLGDRPLDAADLVERCEEIIAIQNGAWRADWLERARSA